MSIKTAARSVKGFLHPAPPTCSDCEQPMERFVSGWMCYQCVARKVLDAQEAEAAAEARRFSAAVLASPEYKALADRVTVLEIAVGNTYDGTEDQS